MQIYKIFKSISNQGASSGKLATYIYTFSSDDSGKYNTEVYHVSPDFVDEYNDQYTVMSSDEILEECLSLGLNRIIFSGGEPLIQNDLAEVVSTLLNNDFVVEIETNGRHSIKEFSTKLVDVLTDDELLNNVLYLLDYKTTSSTVKDLMLNDNIDYLNEPDTLQLIVRDETDLTDAIDLIKEHETEANVIITPKESVGITTSAQALLENNIQTVRILEQADRIEL